ncbi:MAG: hypothetical protein JXQ90_15895 [Cyclobacteriaceae bacterium]
MKSIAIVSILKPVNEVRMYERFAQSLAKTNKYKTNIIGIPSKSQSHDENLIEFFTITNSNRDVSIRLFNLFQVFIILNKIKPDLIIITSPELILPLLLLRIFKRAKIIYDIQEDYSNNITFQRIYKGPMKRVNLFIHAQLHRLILKKAKHILLAESIYEKQIETGGTPAIILENKSTLTRWTYTNRAPHKLLFSGIISNYSGINRALEFFRNYQQSFPVATLTIIGKSYDRKLIKQLNIIAEENPAVHLIGLNEFVEHDLIKEAIYQSSLGIISYELNEVSQNRIPTKLFEYASAGLPFVVQSDSEWAQHSCGIDYSIPIDFNRPDYQKILARQISILNSRESNSSSPAHWTSVEQQFTSCIDTLI